MPDASILVSAAFSCLAYKGVGTGAKNVFMYLNNMVTVFGKRSHLACSRSTGAKPVAGLLIWISILVTHIDFRQAVKAQGLPREVLAYRSIFGSVGSFIALGFLSILILTKSFDVFIHGFDVKDFVVGYIGLPVYLICILGWKIAKRTRRVKPKDADLVTGVSSVPISEKRAQHKAERQRQLESSTGFRRILILIHRRAFSWLF